MAAPSTLTVRFSVVAFAPPGSKFAVVGSHAGLGSWDPEKGPRMACSLGETRFESEPDYWWADVKLPVSEAEGLPFKFVLRSPGASEWRWEGRGSGDNRCVTLADGDVRQAGALALLPVELFAEGSGSEHEHTGRFYAGLRDCGEISTRRVSENIILGSCPRRVEHVDRLRRLGVTAVMNFQTEADCIKNCVEGIGMEDNVLEVGELYDRVGIQYTWLPTWDMSTAGRAAMLPHASYIMAGLIKRGHVVYVHCNAGVGRSVGAVCGYLMYCMGLSAREMQHVVARARTVAFFDFAALERARPHYEAMFGPPDAELAERKAALLRDALIFPPGGTE